MCCRLQNIPLVRVLIRLASARINPPVYRASVDTPVVYNSLKMLNLIAEPGLLASNDDLGAAKRERTVPIPESITHVPGYPAKLCIYKMQASKFWQVRCWIRGRTYRRSTRTESLRQAQSAARIFYETWLAENYITSPPLQSKKRDDDSETINRPKPINSGKPMTFGAMAAQLYANEKARVDRKEWALGSLQVLRNRLDAHILPRYASKTPQEVGYQSLVEFTNVLSDDHSAITINQYLVAVRKVLRHAVAAGELDALPVFPKVKIVTKSRGAFTPTEYRRIIRMARSLKSKQHPESGAAIRIKYKVRSKEQHMPADLAWAIGFMVNSFIRPSDLKTLKHKHIEIVRSENTYLRLTLPMTKSHDFPIVTLYPAVRIYAKILKENALKELAKPDDYVFMPHLKDRNYVLAVLSFHLNWVLSVTGLKLGAHSQPRSLYSFRHSSITFRLLYGQGIDLLTLARNARTSVNVINTYYASTVTGEQNIALLQSRRTKTPKP